MRILLTNDDGIRADGLEALCEVLTGSDPEYPSPFASEMLVVAPETVQSATSHGITFSTPIMAQELPPTSGPRRVAVDGRPADCVKIALSAIWRDHFGADSRPDLVLSGINSGANAGINVLYSGTVAAAIEAAFLGVPSIALSLHVGGQSPDWVGAARRTRRVLELLLAPGLPRPHECLSVNFPKQPFSNAEDDRSKFPEVVVCPMNVHGMNDRYERRVSPKGQTYYWLSGAGLDFTQTDPNSDVAHLLAGRITVTPLHYDLSRDSSMEWWRDICNGH
ncbi:MAG: 5'/3'-nucleotidase SurE [Planctomycetes bacterium]|nr:5'/3'-nucleotidase SurE [Planctomycetota bacterium]